MASCVRLTALTLENFKNVIHGKLTFPELENGGSVLDFTVKTDRESRPLSAP